MPRALADAAWPHFDQGTQRAILRLYRSSPRGAPRRRRARDLDRVVAPALVLWGDRDPFIPARFADGYAAALRRRPRRAPPGAGHWPWHDDPEVVERVLRFLAEPV